MTLPRLLLLLVLVVVFVQEVNADGHLFSESGNYTGNSSSGSILETPQTLARVECPSQQTTFVALTEMVMEGRNELLTLPERLELNSAFLKIYNSLTQQSCDSYFRRLANLTFVNMTNNLGDVFLMSPPDPEDDDDEEIDDDPEGENDEQEGRRRRRLRSLQSAASSFATTNTSTIPGVGITYQVVGTCRDCPVSRTGSFKLYDDSFRRLLREKSGFDLRPLRILNILVDKETSYTDDCVCVEGTQPEEPVAPGVQECVDEMNLKFDNLRANSGLFENIEMVDLLQFDDLEEEGEVEDEGMEEEEEEEGGDDMDEEEEEMEEEEEEMEEKEEEEEVDESVSRSGNEDGTTSSEKEDNDQESNVEPTSAGSSGRSLSKKTAFLAWILLGSIIGTAATTLLP